MGAVLEQRADCCAWEPLAFFSQKLSSAQRNYSAYDRELVAIYEVVRYFRYFIGGRAFKILTDHKPLVYAFVQRSEKASPRQVRQLSFIAQFTTHVEHVSGPNNVVTDTLSRAESFRMPLEINLKEVAVHQETDIELKQLCSRSDPPLKLVKIQWGPAHTSVFL